MSNNEETWQPRTPTDGEYTFEGWLYWETKLGEFGNPGFRETTELMKIPKVFGSEEPRTVYMTTYRQDEDGLLLCILLRYYDDAGVRHPLLYLVHPDHRGKGIATRMALYQEERFINEEASTYGYTVEEFRALTRDERANLVMPLIGDVSTNESGARFGVHMNTFFHTVEKDFTQGT